MNLCIRIFIKILADSIIIIVLLLYHYCMFAKGQLSAQSNYTSKFGRRVIAASAEALLNGAPPQKRTLTDDTL